jgi:hypothetical protein
MTGNNLVLVTGSNPVINGTTVQTPPYLDTYGPKEAAVVSALDQVAGGSGAATASNVSVVDRVTFDASLTAIPPTGSPEWVPVAYGNYIGNFAKNGSVLLTLSSTTAQTVSLLNTASASPTSTAGDTVFANINVITFWNNGSEALSFSLGSSDPAPLPKFTGTTPAVTIPAGSFHVFHSAAAQAISSGACNLTVTPTSGGECVLTFMGS